jgi:hypothetical protein
VDDDEGRGLDGGQCLRNLVRQQEAGESFADVRTPAHAPEFTDVTLRNLDEDGQAVPGEEVVLASDGVILLSGTPDTACSWPGPVEMGTTPLCFTDPGDPATGGPSGEVGWAVYDDGTEELWVWAFGLESSAEYGLLLAASAATRATSGARCGSASRATPRRASCPCPITCARCPGSTRSRSTSPGR